LYKQRDPKHKTFVMAHCWSLLQNNEKWVKRNNNCHPLKKPSTCSLGSVQGNEEDEETASPTLTSAMPANKRPPGRKQEKERVKKGGDHAVFQTAVQEMITSRKELEPGKKQDKESRWMEIKALEERKVKIEEDKLETKKMKQECKIMFMDISGFDETQKAFVKTMRAQILVSRMGVNGSGGENSSA
jgi:hypothetical protein